MRTTDGQPDYFVSVIEDIGARKAAEAAQQRYQGGLPVRPDMLTLREGSGTP